MSASTTRHRRGYVGRHRAPAPAGLLYSLLARVRGRRTVVNVVRLLAEVALTRR